MRNTHKKVKYLIIYLDFTEIVRTFAIANEK